MDIFSLPSISIERSWYTSNVVHTMHAGTKYRYITACAVHKLVPLAGN